jgi:UDP-2,4-diacetamido-2,4,6-trideoxy-beta-L-altropyranose hydrolase
MTAARIVFLPDFGPSIGGGHVMRSLTLARALRERGARCAFAVGKETARMMRPFAGDDVEIWDVDAWPEPPAVAVVDNYALTADDERSLARRGVKVVAIDDIGRVHDCALVVDPGLGRTAADYPDSERVLAGPAYALVRPEFLTTPITRRGGRVLVSLGLTDVGGITAEAVARLAALPGWDAADVVLGSTAGSLEYVREVAAHDPRFTLHVETGAMAELIARADLAVGAGGGSVWERACLGLPTLLLILADNQRPMARRLESEGAVVALDVAEPGFGDAFERELGRLLSDDALRDRLSRVSKGLCDGRGAGRVADAILALAADSAPSERSC